MLKNVQHLGQLLSKDQQKLITGEIKLAYEESGCYSNNECTSSIDCGGCACNWHPSGTYQICIGY